MGLFDQFPYTNFHELNLNWILKALKELEHTIDQFVAINALKYADPIQWDITSQYEKNTIVIDPQTGTAYISVQPVPIGVALTNPDYWTVVFDLGSFVVRAAKNLSNTYEADTTLTATVSTAAGGWIVWGDTLYRAISNIVAGDQYVVDSNIQHFTIEDVIGHLEDLTTSDKSNIVAAINAAINEVMTIIGSLTDLTTADKDSIVDAINEVMTIIGSLTDLTTLDKDSIVNAINEQVTNISVIDALIGNENLTTIAQTLKGAINEVYDKLKKVFLTPEMFGAYGDGIHDDTIALQDAINNSERLLLVGKYKVTSQLAIRNAIKIEGRPSVRSSAGLTTKPSIIADIATDNVVISISGTGVSGIIMENILIDANTKSGIYLGDDAYHCIFRNVEIYNCADGFNLGRSWNHIFDGCIVNIASNAGWKTTGTVTSTTWNSCVVYNAAYGWYLTGGTVYSVLNACAIDHSTRGIVMSGSGNITCNNFGAESYSSYIITQNTNAVINLIGGYTIGKIGTNPTFQGTGICNCMGCTFNSDDVFNMDKLYGYRTNTPSHDGVVTYLDLGKALNLPSYYYRRENFSTAIALPTDYYCKLHATNTLGTVTVDAILDSTDVDNALYTYTAANHTLTPKQGLNATFHEILL